MRVLVALLLCGLLLSPTFARGHPIAATVDPVVPPIERELCEPAGDVEPDGDQDHRPLASRPPHDSTCSGGRSDTMDPGDIYLVTIDGEARRFVVRLEVRTEAIPLWISARACVTQLGRSTSDCHSFVLVPNGTTTRIFGVLPAAEERVFEIWIDLQQQPAEYTLSIEIGERDCGRVGDADAWLPPPAPIGMHCGGTLAHGDAQDAFVIPSGAAARTDVFVGAIPYTITLCFRVPEIAGESCWGWGRPQWVTAPPRAELVLRWSDPEVAWQMKRGEYYEILVRVHPPDLDRCGPALCTGNLFGSDTVDTQCCLDLYEETSHFLRLASPDGAPIAACVERASGHAVACARVGSEDQETCVRFWSHAADRHARVSVRTGDAMQGGHYVVQLGTGASTPCSP